MDIQKRIGEKIRMYRKLSGLSLEELAAKIHKSKSILSKYELGESVFDMDTMYMLASALDIEPAQLLEPRLPSSRSGGEKYGIFVNNTLYAYMVVRDKSYHLMKSVMTFGGEDGCVASFYMQVPDFTHYTDCKVLYTGRLYCHQTNAMINLVNQADKTDHAVLSVAVRMGNISNCLGLMIMSGYATNDPGALKTLLAKAPVADEEELTRFLTINREDIDSTRKSNIFGYCLSMIDRELLT